MTVVKIITFPSNTGPNGKLNLIECRKCGIKFLFNEKIVSKHSIRSTKRYHIKCAEALNII